MAKLATGARTFFGAVLRDLDLYALMLAAVVFTFLGVYGIADTKTLSSVVLSLLALLAFSQVKSRRLATVGEAGRSLDRLFDKDFPEELKLRRSDVKSDYLFLSRTGARTMQTTRKTIAEMLARGVRVRILLLDPSDEPLLNAVARAYAEDWSSQQVRRSILVSLSECESLVSKYSNLSVRLMSIAPQLGVNAIDIDRPGGVLYVQHYEYRAPEESAPMLTLRSTDGYWYRHCLAEIERIWSDARPWKASELAIGGAGAERKGTAVQEVGRLESSQPERLSGDHG